MLGIGKSFTGFWTVCVVLALIIFPQWAWGKDYPNKPISLYIGFDPGGGMDISARALAAEVEKILGVPVIAENKPGGGGTVCATLLASKKPDGYSLGVIATYAMAISPHLVKVTFDPLKDFTPLCYYSRYTGALVVLSESPFKTINDFITYAKAHPGLSYTSVGLYTSQQLATEIFAQCKGLTFKHIPTKGGMEAYRQLLGKHVDFTAGSGSHLMYVRQGLFRQLVMYHTDKRDPDYPDVPTLSELGCQDLPASKRGIFGPKGLPKDISEKLNAAFRKAAEKAEFQKSLKNVDIPYEYNDGKEFESQVQKEYYWYKDFFAKTGVKK